ncbi:hypothetical protein F947_00701 [Acinetobacter towneri DSM 14962 = CIP 107472]|nr:hypothetical protein F947_00701 [Acinetobacter towneri DSM 14962 = CIP 107472]
MHFYKKSEKIYVEPYFEVVGVNFTLTFVSKKGAIFECC